jgi:hypothetical protein
MRYEVLKVVNIKVAPIWDVTSCSLPEKFFYPEDGGRKFL